MGVITVVSIERSDSGMVFLNLLDIFIPEDFPLLSASGVGPPLHTYGPWWSYIVWMPLLRLFSAKAEWLVIKSYANFARRMAVAKNKLSGNRIIAKKFQSTLYWLFQLKPIFLGLWIKILAIVFAVHLHFFHIAFCCCYLLVICTIHKQ